MKIIPPSMPTWRGLHVLAFAWLLLAVAASPSAPAQTTTSPFPSFPQSFHLDSPVPASYPLAITQAGPVVIDIDTAGSPVALTLQTPGMAPMQRQGSGHIEIAYTVTPADVQRSTLWNVSIALVPPTVPVASLVANGTVRVSQPPSNVAAALAEANNIARTPRPHYGPTPADLARMESARADAQARYNQFVAQAQAQRLAQNQPLVDQLRARAAPVVGTRGLPALSTLPGTSAQPANAIQAQPVAVQPQMATVQPVAPALKVVPATAPPPPPPPVITGLQVSPGANLTSAGPGDEIVIIGKNFGNVPSDVVFILGTQTFPASALNGCWSDTLIVVQVPQISGFVQGPAGVWVQLNPANSNTWPFTFTPALEYRHVYWTNDKSLSPGAQSSYVAATGLGDIYHSNTTFGSMGGNAGNDSFFFNTPLNPGWAPQNISFVIYGTGMPLGPGGVYVQQSGLNANPPALRFTARWYYNGFQDIDYGYDVLIAGPRGTPDGVVVTH